MINTGRHKEAIKHLERTVSIRPGFVEALNNIGFAYLELGKLVEAGSYFKKAINIDPSYYEAYENLSSLQFKQGKFEDGLKSVFKGCGAVEFSDDQSDHFTIIIG